MYMVLWALGATMAVKAEAGAEAPAFGHYAPTATYAEQVSSSFYLPMRDGVRIALRVTRPARNGAAVEQPLPVIWQGTLSVAEPERSADSPVEAGYRDV